MCSFGMYVIQATRVSDASTKVAATATNFNAANFFILLIRPTAQNTVKTIFNFAIFFFSARRCFLLAILFFSNSICTAIQEFDQSKRLTITLQCEVLYAQIERTGERRRRLRSYRCECEWTAKKLSLLQCVQLAGPAQNHQM